MKSFVWIIDFNVVLQSFLTGGVWVVLFCLNCLYARPWEDYIRNLRVKHFKISLLVLFLIININSFISAQEVNSDHNNINIFSHNTESDNPIKNFQALISAGIGKMSGHTTYQIGGTTKDPSGTYELHDPLSELMFPIEIYTINLDASFFFFQNFNSNLSFKTNITDRTGNMEDRDWGIPWEKPTGSGVYYWYGPDHLDVYSESKTDMTLYIFNLDLLYEVYRNNFSSCNTDFQIYAGLGYLYQEFDFECRLIRQYDLRGDDVPVDQQLNFEGDGSVGLTYNVKSHIPYLEISSLLIYDQNILLKANIGYSPYVMVNDRDNHKLRNKISKAECTGSSLLFSFAGSYFFENNIFIKGQFDYVKVDTEGKQKQYENGSWSATIDQKNFSERNSLDISAGYVFN